MSQIKVRAGQVWECNIDIGGYEPVDRLRVGDKSGDFNICYAINFDRGANRIKASDKFLRENFTFIPQCDVEILAVKLDNWYCASDWLCIHNGVPFICDDLDLGGIHRDQWQNMRYYLGLDKKPHYRLIDGEWVRQ